MVCEVIICGSLHLDIMVAGPLPVLDETAIGSAWGRKCGGKGGNQAIAAARAGAATAMIGRVGSDEFGATLLQNLARHGVDHSEVAIDAGQGSGMSVAIVNETGGYGAVIVSGANLAIPPESLGDALAQLGGAVLVLQNEVPETVNRIAARAAKAQGMKVLLNAAPMRAMSAEMLASIDLLVLNRVEAEQMAGITIAGKADAERLAEKLTEKVPHAIITLGGDGLVLASRDVPALYVAAEKVTVVSTHGAGDAFVGTLACEWARGTSLENAVSAASHAAALHISGQSKLGQ